MQKLLKILKLFRVPINLRARTWIFNIKQNEIILDAHGDGKGYGRESFKFIKEESEIEADVNIDGDIAIGFNPIYIIDVLKIFNFEKVALYVKDSISPCVFEFEEDKNSQFIVMPLKV